MNSEKEVQRAASLSERGEENAENSLPDDAEMSAERLKALFSGPLLCGKSSEEELNDLDLSDISRSAAGIKELIDNMSLDDLLDYNFETKKNASEADDGVFAEILTAERSEERGAFLHKDLEAASLLNASSVSEIKSAEIKEKIPESETASQPDMPVFEPGSPEELRERIKAYRKTEKIRTDSSGIQAVGFVFSFGAAVGAVIFVFWWASKYLAAAFGAWIVAPFMLAGVLFGLFTGFYMMLPYLRRLEREHPAEKDSRDKS